MKPSLKPSLLSNKSKVSSSNGSSSNGSHAPNKKKGGKKANCLLRTTLSNNAFEALHNPLPPILYNVPWCTVVKVKKQMHAGLVGSRCGNHNPEEVIVDHDDIPKEKNLRRPAQSNSPTPILKLDDGNKPRIGRFNVHYLVVSSNNDGNLGVMYAITGKKTFKEIYDDYAEKVDCRVKDMFLTNSRTGAVISPQDIARNVGLRHGYMLHASHKNPQANMDAWIKKFYLTDVSDNPRKVKVEGRLDTKLSNIYHMWGDAFNFDPKKVMMMNQCRVLSPSQTIGGAKIRNKGVVYALPNVRYHRCVRESDIE